MDLVRKLMEIVNNRKIYLNQTSVFLRHPYGRENSDKRYRFPAVRLYDSAAQYGRVISRFSCLLVLCCLIEEKYYDLTVRDNIGLGSGEETHELRKVMKAGVQSGAHDHIRSLDSYYETILGGTSSDRHRTYYAHGHIPSPREVYSRHKERDYPVPFLIRYFTDTLHSQAKFRGRKIVWKKKPERVIDTTIPPYQPCFMDKEEEVEYSELSGGQWQRVALARAFMKIKDADLLILDEPSSALDPKAEYEVFKSLMDLRKNKTTIFIVSRTS
jgi:ABC-type Fe3+/spermidine/putrescine transport system ATPase subunit